MLLICAFANAVRIHMWFTLQQLDAIFVAPYSIDQLKTRRVNDSEQWRN